MTAQHGRRQQADDRDQRDPEQRPRQHRDWPRPRPGGDEHAGPAQANYGSGGQQPAGGLPAAAGIGEGGHDHPWLAEFGYSRARGRIRVMALAEVAVVGLIQPVGQLLDNPARKISRQGCEIVVDQVGSGHGAPSSAALIIAAKSRQSARFPDKAPSPAAVS
jgi:hypothetical protein